MISRRPALAVLGSVVTLAACAPPLGVDGPETVRGPAILVHFGDTTTVTLPTSARVGLPVSIVVTSFGGGCIAQGETELTVRGLEAEIRPYRYETVHMACTDDLRIYQHTVSVQFGASGDARVRILGVGRPGDMPYVVERELTVLP